MLVCRRVAKGATVGLVLLLLALTAFWAGQRMSAALGAGLGAACADEAAAPTTAAVEVTYRAATIEGQPAGEVLINGQAVLRIRIAAGGLSAEERAMVVAKRIEGWTAEGADPAELTAVEVAEGGWAVIAGDTIIVTITDEDAAASQATTMGLAWMWRNNIAATLGAEPVSPEEPQLAEQPAVTETPATAETPTTTEAPPTTETPTVTEEAAAAEWTPPEPYDDKIVPIVSVLEGVRIGAARVNGPKSKVDLVQGVAQLETHFKKLLEIDIYVPITTEKPGKKLDRVQGVGVTALGDYRL